MKYLSAGSINIDNILRWINIKQVDGGLGGGGGGGARIVTTSASLNVRGLEIKKSETLNAHLFSMRVLLTSIRLLIQMVRRIGLEVLPQALMGSGWRLLQPLCQ